MTQELNPVTIPSEEKHLYKLPTSPFSQIPKKIHVIWVGDENKRPDSWIQTWKDKHPEWEFRIWGNAELNGLSWKSKKQMDIFRSEGQWNGVADLMRYEILYEHGGVYVDADSVCVRTLDDWLLDTRLFAVWENEEYRPGLIACGFVGCIPKHPALRALVRAASRLNKPTYRRNWKTLHWKGFRPRFHYKGVKPWISVGPVFFTNVVMPFCPFDVTILPSVMFLPQHHFAKEERQSSLIYAKHIWGSTHELYSEAAEAA